MMTSSNGNIFRVTGPLCGEFTGHGEFHAQRPVTQSFDVFFDLRLNKRLDWVNNREAGDLRRYRAHYDVIVMFLVWATVMESLFLTIQWRHNERDGVSNHRCLEPFVQAQIKENIEASSHWPLRREFTGYRWIPRSKGQ